MSSETRKSPPKSKDLLRWRLMVQVVFIVIHVALIKATIPNFAWAVYGLIFWGVLVYLTARTGRWVCGWVCWLGGIQDVMGRWSRQRVTFNPRITQVGTLIVACLWVPLAWLIMRRNELPHESPVGFSSENPLSHLMHLALLGIVAGSVFLFGKRGACRYFCPFGIVVDGCRKYHEQKRNPKTGEFIPLTHITHTASQKTPPCVPPQDAGL